MVRFEQFQPQYGDNSLVLDVHAPVFEEPVAYVDEHLSRLGVRHFIDEANKVEQTGSMQYKLVGSADQSQQELILMPGTFGNGIWPHLVARAEAVRVMAQTAGLHSDSGDPLPVLMVAAPNLHSRFGLDSSERDQVAHGNYTAIAERHVRLIDGLGYGAFQGVFYSQAAALAEKITYIGYHTKNVGNVVIGEPPHVQRKSLLATVKGFISEGSGFKAEIEDEAVTVIQDLFSTKQAAKNFELGVLAAGKENLAVVRGFGRGFLPADLVDLNMNTRNTVTLLHASDSKVTDVKAIHKVFEEAVNSVLTGNELNRLEITGTNHSLADRVGRFATLVAASLTV